MAGAENENRVFLQFSINKALYEFFQVNGTFLLRLYMYWTLSIHLGLKNRTQSRVNVIVYSGPWQPLMGCRSAFISETSFF